MTQKVYIIENLDCANCAAKIEAKFNALPEVENATIIFPTRQLRLTAENPDSLIDKLAKPETPVIQCYNKADLVYSEDIPSGKNIIAISAKKGMNMDGLKKAIENALAKARHHVVLNLPYSMGGMVETLHNNAQVKNVEYTGEGIQVETVVDDILYGRLREYIVKEC